MYGAVCDHAAAFLRGDLTRIVVIHPPNTYKSGVWSFNLPPYAWLHCPWMKFICVSNGTTLVTELSRKSRDVVESEWYRQTFNPSWRLRDDQNTQQFFTNTLGGHRQGISTGAPVIGKKANRIVVDDLHDADKVKSPKQRKSDKDWFYRGLMDRLIDEDKDCIAVVGHRVDSDDIAGECIDAGWPVLHIPEVWQEHFRKLYPAYPYQGGRYKSDPRQEGDYLRPSIGPKQEEDIRSRGNGIWATKYQGMPESAEGSMFPTEKVNRLREIPIGTVCVRFWDTAASIKEGSSWTCGVLIGQQPNGRFLVVDVQRKRLKFDDRDNLILNKAFDDKATRTIHMQSTAIEHPGGSGGVQAAELLVRKLKGFVVKIKPVSGTGSKLYRAGPFSSQWLGGNVDVIEDVWTKGYLARMENVHNSTEQDDMDASSGAFNDLVSESLESDEMPLVADTPPVDDMAEGTYRRAN